MKTLDEVIKACEETVSDVDRGVDIEGCYLGATETKDALHYLKEYRTLQTAYIKAMADLEDNPPLTWSELEQMEGKPVWVEADHAFIQYIGWVLIDKIDDSCKDTGMVFTVSDRSEFFLLKDFIGNTWQAYRKERK